jgi:putative ABC transport system permease protein
MAEAALPADGRRRAGLALLLWRSPFSPERRIALIFLGAMVFAFVALRLVAMGIEWIARHAPQVRSTELRLALGNIHRPGALTPSVVLSLGLGLTLIVTLALIDGNLRRQISSTCRSRRRTSSSSTSRAPTLERFSANWWRREAPEGELAVPCRCCAAGSRASTASRRARSIRRRRAAGCCAATAASPMPRSPVGSTIVEGEWWPAGL